MKQQFATKRFSQSASLAIDMVNKIIGEYDEQGLSLTLRQIYYQFVSRDLIANNDKEYKRLGDIVSDGRMAGLIDWSAIEDRTRYLRSTASWDSPAQIVRACANQFKMDPWKHQKTYVEVWVEKDALIGVIESACDPRRVPHFSCRGYASQTALYDAGRRIARQIDAGKEVLILHFGDHDPSGIDMTRDIRERVAMFARGGLGEDAGSDFDNIEVRRLALNFDQIKSYKPPPNPAKITDSRAAEYIRNYGHQSWELDALEPRVLIGLIERELDAIIDEDDWETSMEDEKRGRAKITQVANKLEKD